MRVSDILRAKGGGVSAIGPDRTVSEALGMIVENKVGSLVVIGNQGLPVGIITERDIIRLAHKSPGDNWRSLPVREVMTSNIIIGLPDDDVEYVMKLMTANRFRHLPIMHGQRLIGLVSIGDIIKSLLGDVKAENRYLSDYIAGKYPV